MDSGFRSRRQSDAARAKTDVQLFQIKGTTELNTRAVEVHTINEDRPKSIATEPFIFLLHWLCFTATKIHS